MQRWSTFELVVPVNLTACLAHVSVRQTAGRAMTHGCGAAFTISPHACFRIPQAHRLGGRIDLAIRVRVSRVFHSVLQLHATRSGAFDLWPSATSMTTKTGVQCGRHSRFSFPLHLSLYSENAIHVPDPGAPVWSAFSFPALLTTAGAALTFSG